LFAGIHADEALESEAGVVVDGLAFEFAAAGCLLFFGHEWLEVEIWGMTGNDCA
jgi:hypothetical protein